MNATICDLDLIFGAIRLHSSNSACICVEKCPITLTPRKNSFSKKVAVHLYYLGSEGGYRETSSVFDESKSWAIAIVSTLSFIRTKYTRKWICLPRSDNEWRIMDSTQNKEYPVSSVE
ncbi:hypothetical protein THRCLA_21545 [Thraustotheca clavata]|uniref:Uncharacterized protein n=1 Tax=Thraustotheca clavata TaxID=74557 RepID=A0A1V9ZVE3_9STRA|nr:hypothetical protein THRCLA_21545 [Thraustotheca clavata]